jgi:hypothetical protein
MPLLIYEFHRGNEKALSDLVAAFSGALSLDYGMYYCVSCNETIPNNDVDAYDANNKTTQLTNGISFYNSDFVVCDQWNAKLKDTIQLDTTAITINVPTLLFTGKYDPITPETNGESLQEKIPNAYIINTKNTGHASSVSYTARKSIQKFIENSSQNPNLEEEKTTNIAFVHNINTEKRIAKMGASFSSPDLVFFGPLLIAILVCLITFFGYLLPLLFKKERRKHIIMKLLLIVSSALAIVVLLGFVYALINTADANFYTLAFGLPKAYEFLFVLLNVFIVVVACAIVYFMINLKKVPTTGVVITVLFSNVLIIWYFFFWNILTI